MDEPDNVVPLRPGIAAAAGAGRRISDPGLRQLCIEWIRKIQSPNADQAELRRIGNAILDTPATSNRSVGYKIAAAAATAAVQLAENHAVTLILKSVLDADNRPMGYKITTAAAIAAVQLAENHAVTLILSSAIDDDNRLSGQVPANAPGRR